MMEAWLRLAQQQGRDVFGRGEMAIQRSTKSYRGDFEQ